MYSWQCSAKYPQVEKVVSEKSAQSSAHFYASMMIMKVCLRKKKQQNHSYDKSVNICLFSTSLKREYSYKKALGSEIITQATVFISYFINLIELLKLSSFLKSCSHSAFLLTEQC